MSRLAPTLATVALMAGTIGAPAIAFAAGTGTCDAYSQSCANVEGKKITKPPAVQGSQLPFSGADIVGYSLAGVVTVGAGVAFGVAGRRRRRVTGVMAAPTR